jgi:hypothetical protein
MVRAKKFKLVISIPTNIAVIAFHIHI